MAGRSCSAASGLRISSYIGSLTFFPHMQDIVKIVFFLFLPCLDPVINETQGMGSSCTSNPHSPFQQKCILSYIFVKGLPGFCAKMVCPSLQVPLLQQ